MSPVFKTGRFCLGEKANFSTSAAVRHFNLSFISPAVWSLLFLWNVSADFAPNLFVFFIVMIFNNMLPCVFLSLSAATVIWRTIKSASWSGEPFKTSASWRDCKYPVFTSQRCVKLPPCTITRMKHIPIHAGLQKQTLPRSKNTTDSHFQHILDFIFERNMHKTRPFHTHPWNLSYVFPRSASSECVLPSAHAEAPVNRMEVSVHGATLPTHTHTHTCMFMTGSCRDDRRTGLEEEALPQFCWAWCLWRAWSESGRNFSDDVTSGK